MDITKHLILLVGRVLWLIFLLHGNLLPMRLEAFLRKIGRQNVSVYLFLFTCCYHHQLHCQLIWMSLFQHQPCMPKQWHYLLHASQMSLYASAQEQFLSISAIWPSHHFGRDSSWSHQSIRLCSRSFLPHLLLCKFQSGLPILTAGGSQYFCHQLLFLGRPIQCLLLR